MKIVMEEAEVDEVTVVIKGKIESNEVKNILDTLKKLELLDTVSYKVEDKIYFKDIKLVEYFIFEDGKVLALIDKVLRKINFNLNELENIKNFIRISKNTIVNKKFIDYVEVEFNGNYLLFMKDKKKFILTRKYVKKFKESMR